MSLMNQSKLGEVEKFFLFLIFSCFSRYKRSLDSEFSAPLVNFYIWPCLVQDGQVVVKGEACTKRDSALVRNFFKF